MRVLHVNKFLYRRGGAESYMFDLAALQEGDGDDVAFYGMSHPDNDRMPYERYFPSHVELREASLVSKVKASARVFYSKSAESGLKHVLDEFKPDVVHLHNIYHHLSPSVLRPIGESRIPAVMTLHDYKLACPSYQLLDHGAVCEACFDGNFFHATMRRCKDGSLGASLLVTMEAFAHRLTHAYSNVGRFIAPSRFLAAKMTEAGVYPDRLRHVNHFVDLQSIPRVDTPRSGFVYAGRLSPEKGVDVLIRALGMVSTVVLEVLGDGPERERLERLAAELAPGRVRFRGRLPKAAVHAAMGSCLAVVMPSRWYENQPMTALEAMACGTPLIGTALGGIPELVDDGLNGLVVPAGEPEALAAALTALASDPTRAGALGGEARSKIAAGFSPELHLRRISQVYAEAGAVGSRARVAV